jgi:hypothetical protein
MVCVLAHVRVHVRVRTCAYVCVRVHACARACVCVRVYVCACVRACVVCALVQVWSPGVAAADGVCAPQIAHKPGKSEDIQKFIDSVPDHLAPTPLAEGARRELGQSLEEVEAVLLAVLRVLDDGRAYAEAVREIQRAELRLNETLCCINAHNGGVSAAVSAVVRLVGRLHVIQTTSYLPEGYAMLDAALVLIFALLTATNWPVDSAFAIGVAYTVVIPLLYIYLRLLIGDLEDPFEFPPNYCVNCYRSSKELPIGAWDEFRKGGSIPSMLIITVTFGRQLHALMEKAPPPPRQEAGECGPDRGLEDHGEAPAGCGADAKRLLARSRLLLRCAPVVLGLVGVRLAVWYGGGTGGWLDQSVFTSFIALAIFAAAIMMLGLLQVSRLLVPAPSPPPLGRFAPSPGATQAGSPSWHQGE